MKNSPKVAFTKIPKLHQEFKEICQLLGVNEDDQHIKNQRNFVEAHQHLLLNPLKK